MHTETIALVSAAGVTTTERESDDRLAARARLGDDAAFEALYRANVGRIHALCVRLAGDRATAEDLTQEVFVRAWRKLGSFRGEAAFATWLYRLALNTAVAALRARAAAGQTTIADDTAWQDRRAPASAPEIGLDLERAIAGLPHGARMVFVLHDVVGWRHEEIARALEIAVGTARTQLHHARVRLREVLR